MENTYCCHPLTLLLTTAAICGFAVFACSTVALLKYHQPVADQRNFWSSTSEAKRSLHPFLQCMLGVAADPSSQDMMLHSSLPAADIRLKQAYITPVTCQTCEFLRFPSASSTCRLQCVCTVSRWQHHVAAQQPALAGAYQAVDLLDINSN
jgi:hypothetical protein